MDGVCRDALEDVGRAEVANLKQHAEMFVRSQQQQPPQLNTEPPPPQQLQSPQYSHEQNQLLPPSPFEPLLSGHSQGMSPQQANHYKQQQQQQQRLQLHQLQQQLQAAKQASMNLNMAPAGALARSQIQDHPPTTAVTPLMQSLFFDDPSSFRSVVAAAAASGASVPSDSMFTFSDPSSSVGGSGSCNANMPSLSMTPPNFPSLVGVSAEQPEQTQQQLRNVSPLSTSMHTSPSQDIRKFTSSLSKQLKSGAGQQDQPFPTLVSQQRHFLKSSTDPDLMLSQNAANLASTDDLLGQDMMQDISHPKKHYLTNDPADRRRSIVSNGSSAASMSSSFGGRANGRFEGTQAQILNVAPSVSESLFGDSDILSPRDGEDDLLGYADNSSKIKSLASTNASSSGGFDPEFSLALSSSVPGFEFFNGQPSSEKIPNCGDESKLDSMVMPLRLDSAPQFRPSFPQNRHLPSEPPFSSSFHDFDFHYGGASSGNSFQQNGGVQDTGSSEISGNTFLGSAQNNVQQQFHNLMLSATFPSVRTDGLYSASVPNNLFFGGISKDNQNSIEQIIPSSFADKSGFDLASQRNEFHNQQSPFKSLPPHMIFSSASAPRSPTVYEEDGLDSDRNLEFASWENGNSNGNIMLSSSLPANMMAPHAQQPRKHMRTSSTGQQYFVASHNATAGAQSQPPLRSSYQPKLSSGSTGSNGGGGSGRFGPYNSGNINGTIGSSSVSLRKRRNSAGFFDIATNVASNSGGVGNLSTCLTASILSSSIGTAPGVLLSSSLKNSSSVDDYDGSGSGSGSGGEQPMDGPGSDEGGGEGTYTREGSATSNGTTVRGGNTATTTAKRHLLAATSPMPALGSSPVNGIAGAMAASLTRGRDFLCAICAKPFMRRQDLRRHEQTHSGVKAYSCPLGCGTNFSRSDALQRHLKARRCQ